MPTDDNNLDKTLWRKLITVIILKLIIILAIWWVFMRPNTPKINDDGVQKHLVSQVFFSPSQAYNNCT